MDANEHFAFPSPQPTDAPEVRSAIEQAGILWSDDPKESLKWLRKAAEFASDAGDDLRSVQLARVSADLRNLANISPSLPPTTLPPPSALAQASSQAVVVNVVAAELVVVSEGTSDGTHLEVMSEPEAETGVEQTADFAGSSPDAPATEITPNVPDVAAQAVAAGFGPQSFAGGVVTDSGQAASDNKETNQPGLSPEQLAAFIPNMAFGKDPAQTVPATPAATAAAAALANNGPSGYQPFGGFQTTGYGAPPPAPKSAPVASAPAASAPQAAPSSSQASASAPRWAESASAAPTPPEGKLAMNTPAATPASKRPVGLMGTTPGAWTGGPRPEQPTLVGSPLNGLRADENFRAEAAVNDPSAVSRFVQHRAIAVAVSMTPNSSGHFDLHPLAEGELVEPGFRMALLVGLSADDRLFPGRG